MRLLGLLGFSGEHVPFISAEIRITWGDKIRFHSPTLTIAGFALDEGKWDGIYLGRRKGQDLVYAGKVDHGFDNASATDRQERLEPLIRKTQPYSKRIAHKGIWVESPS